MIQKIISFFQRYPHWPLLLYWPLYGAIFELLEWFVEPPSYHVMYCWLDDHIHRSAQVILHAVIALLMFIVYPSVQHLRPEVMPRDNIFTDMVAYIYHIDTNTNVCPSLHVVGGVAVWFASLHCKQFQTTGWRTFFLISTVLICISTVFLKQHSLVDIPAALVICAIGYPLAFGKRAERRMRRRRPSVKSA